MHWFRCMRSYSQRAGAAAVEAGSDCQEQPAKVRLGRPTASPRESSLHALLCDYRLVRVAGSGLVFSHVVGKASSFLSQCCASVDCASVAPVVAPA